MLVDLVALDLETTGLDPRKDAIIEIGAVRLRDGQIVDEYTQLVDPGVSLPPVITDITGIRPDQLFGMPSIRAVLPDFIRFVGSAPVIGHNVDFDLNFLAPQGTLRDNLRLDTLELAAVLVPRAARYSLGNLVNELGIELKQAHRALDDARATAQLYWRLWQRALKLPTATLNEIVAAARGQHWSAEPVFRAALEEQGQLLSASGSGIDGKRLFPAAVRQAPLSAPENPPAPLEPAEIQKALHSDGPLATHLPGFRERPQQQRMAQEVSAAFNEGVHLMIEAGTGVGKSLAYLLPAARWAQLNSRRVIISTNTINLQEQLLHKDLPILQLSLKQPLHVALLKGRNNYLCPRRLTALRKRAPASLEELRTLCKILVWLQDSQSGDRGELSLRGPGEFYVWSRLSAEDPFCSQERCRSEMEGTCPFHKARRAAESAHLLIVNHALLLTDAANEFRVLPPYNALVIDEAQHLEEVVSDVFGFRLDEQTLRQKLGELGSSDSGILGDLLHSAQGQVSREVWQQLKEVTDAIAGVGDPMEHHSGRLFRACREFAASLERAPSDYTTRLRVVPALRNHIRFGPILENWQTLALFFSDISEALRRLTESLRGTEFQGESDLDDHLDSVEFINHWFVATRQQLEAFIEKPVENSIYWLEVPRERSNPVTLHAAPLHAGPLVEEHLWRNPQPVVLTSATLRSNGNFNHIRERLDADDVRAVEVGSPFDYRASTLLFVPNDIPEPAQRESYQSAVERGLIELAAALNGRTLALFTSYRQLRQTTQGITARLALGGIEVYSQSGGSSRAALLRSFRQSEKAILLGTRSFWEGIDVPGDDLSALVIVRLPFTVPTDPVFAARSETFDNAFNDYAVPDAILRFRQGFGRLIRSHEDRGVVAIFDRRVLSKRYGRQFLDSLPECTRRYAPLAALPDAAQRWLQHRV